MSKTVIQSQSPKESITSLHVGREQSTVSKISLFTSLASTHTLTSSGTPSMCEGFGATKSGMFQGHSKGALTTHPFCSHKRTLAVAAATTACGVGYCLMYTGLASPVLIVSSVP